MQLLSISLCILDTLQNVVGQGTAGYQRHYSEPNIQHHSMCMTLTNPLGMMVYLEMIFIILFFFSSKPGKLARW